MTKLFIPYVMGNQHFIRHVKLMDKCGADFIEIGLPFSDPVADGPVIMEAGQQALKEGMTVKKILTELDEAQHDIHTPYLLMTYYNLIDYYGVEQFIEDAHRAGVYGFIIPDLPFELGQRFKEKLKPSNMTLISLIAMTSSETRIQQIAEEAEGFIYTVTMNATTGNNHAFHDGLFDKLQLIKRYAAVPVVCGFGIKSTKQIQDIAPHCDGVVFGSEIVKRLAQDSLGETEKYLKSIRLALNK